MASLLLSSFNVISQSLSGVHLCTDQPSTDGDEKHSTCQSTAEVNAKPSQLYVNFLNLLSICRLLLGVCRIPAGPVLLASTGTGQY